MTFNNTNMCFPMFFERVRKIEKLQRTRDTETNSTMLADFFKRFSLRSYRPFLIFLIVIILKKKYKMSQSFIFTFAISIDINYFWWQFFFSF